MGGGTYDPAKHATTSSVKRSMHGTAFVYNATAHASGIYAVHDTLDPKIVAGATSPFVGSVMRESRDSDEHPESLPIAVFFDVTGSMGGIPVQLQEKLPKLYGLLLARGYVEHPQILFGAIGDARSGDRVPLQIGQFESDNRADEQLENLFLEGGGGGGNHESYELAAYFVANHTSSDAWEKRGKRGYLFLIGDERVYSTIDRREVERLIGDTLQENLDTREVFAKLQEKWEVFFLFASQGSYDVARVLDPAAGDAQALGWRDVLGQNALILEDANAVCETIATAIGLAEGAVDLDGGLAILADEGTSAKTIEATGKALAAVGGGGLAEKGEADGDLDLSDDAGAERL